MEVVRLDLFRPRHTLPGNHIITIGACLARVHIDAHSKLLWVQIYAIVALVLASLKLHDLENKTPVSAKGQGKRVFVNSLNRTADDIRAKEPTIQDDIELAMDIKPGKSLCIYQIVAEIILVLLMIFVIVWLRWLRNIWIFVLVSSQLTSNLNLNL